MKPHTRFRRFVLSVAVISSALMLLSPTTAQAAGFGRKLVAGGLDFPDTFTFTPGGRIFYGEKASGEIHIVNPSQHTNQLFFRVPNVVSNGEQGMLGLALHPDYPKTPLVYAYATRSVGGSMRDQIVKITDQTGHGRNMQVIFSSKTVSGSYHDGGRILFGSDGMLYAIQGEAHDAGNAQNLGNSAGKILRMTPAGKAAPGNPFINSSTRDRRIWAFGIRNSFGFTFDPQTNRLWETENGQDCNDELNRIVKGGNMGWGPKSFNNDCRSGSSPGNTNQDGPTPRIQPKRWYGPPTIAPTGTVFCQRCGLGSPSGGRLFFGDYKLGNIHRITLTSNRLGVASQGVVFTNPNGILSMERGPGGGIYFSDSGGIYRLIRT